MSQYLLSERFKLELRWQEVLYVQKNKCKIVGAYFTGPVLQVAQKINPNDHIILDFYSQYLKLVNSVYTAKFYWGDVSYSDDGKSVYLKDAFLEHSASVTTVPVLKISDYFVIDTSDHVVEKHSNFLVYKTYLINSDNTLYRFEK